jgi:hypothetical protein
MTGIKFWLYQYSGLLLTFLVFAMLGIVLSVVDTQRTLALTALGTVLSLAYFFQKQKLDETKLFKELFVEFNTRYEKLSGALDRLDPDAIKKYFDLCAEEYLFYSRGYIHPDAWRAWLNGMRFVFSQEKVKTLWDEEKARILDAAGSSYYGFEKLKLR